MIYTGIGSRNAPEAVLDAAYIIGWYLHRKGFVLRSGAADGLDLAFQGNVKSSIRNGDEIYLPWNSFNGSCAKFVPLKIELEIILEQVLDKQHFDNLRKNNGAFKLHCRNVYQVLGEHLDRPSDFVVCWTKDGKCIGGTATALKLANKHNIPIINLGDVDVKNVAPTRDDYLIFFFDKFNSLIGKQ